MKRAALFAFVAGAAIMAMLIVHAGAGTVAQAMVTLGLGGLAVAAVLHLPVVALLGLGWWAIGRGVPGAGPWKFVWARLVRDAAADVLPFSQVGGFVIGARALKLMGLRIVPVGVSMLVDLVIELSAKLPYVLAGLILLLYIKSGSGLLRPAFLGLGLTAAGLTALAFFRVRIEAMLERAAMALGGRWPSLELGGHAATQPTFDRVFSRDGRMLTSFLLHAVGEVSGAVETWVMFRLIGVPITGVEALLIDSLTSGLRTFGFLVPGALGVQEAVYVLACGAVGIPPAMGIAFSLARRARDFAIGLPGLGAWQAVEGRRLFAGPGTGSVVRKAG